MASLDKDAASSLVVALNQSMYPTINVIVPCYNQLKYLRRAVASVAWQLWPNDEVLVIDDCSPEFTSFDSLNVIGDHIVRLRNVSRKGVSY